jgi:hypothetical protein
LQGKTPNEFNTILTEKLREHAPSYSTAKNWVVHFKSDDFSTYFALRLGRHKTVTTPEIIDKIHELISRDRRFSAKSIAENLGISREQFPSFI